MRDGSGDAGVLSEPARDFTSPSIEDKTRNRESKRHFIFPILSIVYFADVSYAALAFTHLFPAWVFFSSIACWIASFPIAIITRRHSKTACYFMLGISIILGILGISLVLFLLALAASCGTGEC